MQGHMGQRKDFRFKYRSEIDLFILFKSPWLPCSKWTGFEVAGPERKLSQGDRCHMIVAQTRLVAMELGGSEWFQKYL